jgi:hypothetical protein
MDRAISTASRDEIIDAIVENLGGEGREHFILPESVSRRWEVIDSYIDRLGALQRPLQRVDRRRRAEADIAKEIDDLLAELEVKLAHPHAPRFNAQILRGIKWMREMCQWQMKARPRPHHPVDHLKRACAHCAFDLMRRFSDLPISGTLEGPFFVITGLLYGVVAGVHDVDVKRACTAVLHHRRP